MTKKTYTKLTTLFLLICLSSCNETKPGKKEHVTAKNPFDSKIVVEVNPDKPMPTADELTKIMIKPISDEEVQRAAKKIMDSSTWEEVKEKK